MPKEKVKIEPLKEGELKRTILRMQELNDKYAALNLEYDALAVKVLATLKPKDVRQYDQLRCVIVQAWQRRVGWKDEAYKMARLLYPTAGELRRWLVGLVRKYPKKPNKASVKLTVVKSAEEQ